jgi:hypothetical protein
LGVVGVRDALQRVTARDRAMVRWVAEQQAVREDVARLLLGRLAGRDEAVSVRTWRPIIDRVEAAGWVRRARLSRDRWVLATALGHEMVGVGWSLWQPHPRFLEHIHALALVRLFLADDYPGSTWWCERDEWRRQREAGQGKRHVPDGVLGLPSGAEVEVEVELTRKSAGRLRELTRRLQRPRWYFTTPEISDAYAAVFNAMTTLEVRPELYPLPDVSGISYEVWR